MTLKGVDSWWCVPGAIGKLKGYLRTVCAANPGFRCAVREGAVSGTGDAFRVVVRHSDDEIWVRAYLGYKLGANPWAMTTDPPSGPR